MGARSRNVGEVSSTLPCIRYPFNFEDEIFVRRGEIVTPQISIRLNYGNWAFIENYGWPITLI